jgi:hypothetical protein
MTLIRPHLARSLTARGRTAGFGKSDIHRITTPGIGWSSESSLVAASPEPGISDNDTEDDVFA